MGRDVIRQGVQMNVDAKLEIPDLWFDVYARMLPISTNVFY